MQTGMSTWRAGRAADKKRVIGNAPPNDRIVHPTSMKHIWAPWRMEYIENHGKDDGCVFCRALSMEDGPDNLIAHRGVKAFVILNRYPYTSGHVMVVPIRHEPTLDSLDGMDRAEMMELTSQSTTVLRQVYQTTAFNVGMNIGDAAGAGVKEHVHVHIVPRWVGDTNFMSALSSTRVLPETLADTWSRISKAFGKRHDE